MVSAKTNAENNINDFLARHGTKGFIKLFLSNYLYELALYYLHTEKNKSHQVIEDTSYRFYVDRKQRVYSPKELERFKQDLRQECDKKATAIVKKLEASHDLTKIGASIADNPKVSRLLQEAFQNIVEGEDESSD